MTPEPPAHDLGELANRYLLGNPGAFAEPLYDLPENLPESEWLAVLTPDELTALIAVVEAAKTVNDWWVMRSMREGDPMDGETGEAKQQARALDAALRPFYGGGEA